MGKVQAEDVVALNLSLKTTLIWHLEHNHFPPVNRIFVPTCMEAIKKVGEGRGDEVIEMPNGKKKSARDIVEGLHLESYLEMDEEEF